MADLALAVAGGLPVCMNLPAPFSGLMPLTQAGYGKNMLVEKYTGYCSIPYRYTRAPWQ
jgi:hypothetical protein